MGLAMDQPFLSIVTPKGSRNVPVGVEPITIGRHPQNFLCIHDAEASRFHCVIERAPQGYVLRDLDSRNGTKVNGTRIKTTTVTPTDVIKIGDTEIRLVLPGGADAPEPAEPAAAHKPSLKLLSKKPHPADAPISPPPARPRPPHRPPPQVKEEPAEEEVEVVEVVKEAPSPLARLGRPRQEDAPEVVEDALLRVDADDVKVDFGSASSEEDDEKYLPVLAESLPDKPFGVGEIALLDCRGHVVHAVESESKQRKVAGSGEAVSVLRYILLICTRARATDVHVEPKGDDYQLRLRIDGSMVDVVHLGKAMGVRLCSLVKILCNIDLQFRDIIQEGHFTSLVPDRKIDYRVSFLPSMFGQKLVVRVLDSTNAPIHLPDLRLPPWMLQNLQHGAQLDQGMILVCGPTGSGKTTTLYALLRDVGVEHRNVVTIEDPVEIEIAGVTQVPVNDDKGNSFPNLLRSMLRQDPDVMMIGEVRDGETARIAMQAAMTGHLVVSTIHTKDSIGAVFRLLDLGVEPYLVASSLHITVSQRLARELCPYCKRAVKATGEQIKKMGSAGQGVKEVFVAVGCARCLKTGFFGRRAFFEMLTTNEDVRDVILKDPTPRNIEMALRTGRFTRLEESGYHLVAQGVTAFDEIERAVGK